MTHLGRMLRSYRGVHGIEQQTMAETIGIQPHQLGRAELGRPDVETLTRILAWSVTDGALPRSRQLQTTVGEA